MQRLNTGITALDTVLGGGLPVGSLTVLAGVPGTGKTILAQQICFSSATPEHKAVYYSTISEPPGRFIANLETFDFFDRSALVDSGCSCVRRRNSSYGADHVAAHRNEQKQKGSKRLREEATPLR